MQSDMTYKDLFGADNQMLRRMARTARFQTMALDAELEGDPIQFNDKTFTLGEIQWNGLSMIDGMYQEMFKSGFLKGEYERDAGSTEMTSTRTNVKELIQMRKRGELTADSPEFLKPRRWTLHAPANVLDGFERMSESYMDFYDQLDRGDAVVLGDGSEVVLGVVYEDGPNVYTERIMVTFPNEEIHRFDASRAISEMEQDFKTLQPVLSEDSDLNWFEDFAARMDGRPQVGIDNNRVLNENQVLDLIDSLRGDADLEYEYTLDGPTVHDEEVDHTSRNFFDDSPSAQRTVSDMRRDGVFDEFEADIDDKDNESDFDYGL